MLAPTGRVKTFLENPERGTLPGSCTIYKAKSFTLEDVKKLLYFTQKALITAAGVNIHLDSFNTSYWPKTDLGELISDPKDYPFCKVLLVQDSMDYDPDDVGSVSIIEASFELIKAILEGQNVYLDLGLIRPSGSVSSKGQVSSGPESFNEIFQAAYRFAKDQTITSFLSLLSTFNAVIRRGGVYKNGAVTTSLPVWNKNFTEYLEANPVTIHPWLKKGAVVPSNWIDFPVEMSQAFDEVNKGNLWLEKAIAAQDNTTWLHSEDADKYERLGHNVCREVLLLSEATCILLPINYGQANEPQDLINGYVEGMEALCEFQAEDHQARAGIYLEAKVDKQVGLGLFGLANLLKLEGITYAQLTRALRQQVNSLKARGVNGVSTKLQDYLAMGYKVGSGFGCNNHELWASAIIAAHSEAARVADRHGMKRAFAIAPTANVSYRYTDREGFVCTPEISPPIGKTVDRLSETVEEKEMFNYGNVEIASEVGYAVYFELASLFQEIMDLTGLGHSISFNIWEDFDFEHMQKWANSTLKATYYRLDVDQSFLDKSDQVKSSCGLNGECG